MKRFLANLGITGVLLTAAAAVQAQTQVTFVGNVERSCILTSSGGVLGWSPQVLSTYNSGGQAATVNVTATSVFPTVSFSAPVLQSAPPGYSNPSLVMEIAYTSPGGANQSATSLPSSYSSFLLNDTVTVDAAMFDMSWFPAGTFEMAVVVTCEN